MDEDIVEIIKRDAPLQRFIRLNLEDLTLLAKCGYAELNCHVKDGKIQAPRKKIVLEGQ